MKIEVQHHHGEGVRKDFYSDASVDNAIAGMERDKGNGITGEKMDRFLSAAADNDQFTEREYSAMKRWVEGNFYSLSPEAQEKWLKFDAAMQGAGGVGTAVKHHDVGEAVIMEGSAVRALLGDIGETAKPAPAPAPQADGVHGATTGSNNPAPTSSPSPEAPSGGAAAGEGSATSKDGVRLNPRMQKILEDAGVDISTMDAKELNALAAQQAMSDYNRMVQLLTNLLQMDHEAKKSIIQNMRA
ncbi:MAG TPA: hypothetical protein VGF45_09190 [Polyangia bacterium]